MGICSSRNNLNNKRILTGKSRNKSPTSYGEGITKASSESSTTRQKVKPELYNIEKFGVQVKTKNIIN